MGLGIGRLLTLAGTFYIGITTGQWQYFAAAAISSQQSVAAKRQQRRARDAANDALQDRLEMLDVVPDAERTLVMGRVRYVEGVRRYWQSGTNEEFLTLAVSFAGHEIDAFESLYLNDAPVTLDGSGWVNEAPYFKGRTEAGFDNGTLDGSGGLVLVLSHTPAGGVVDAVWRTGSGDGEQQGALTVVSLVGTTLTLSGGPAGASAWVSYSYATGDKLVRIRTYSGAAGQNVGAAIAGDFAGEITSAEKFDSIALGIMQMQFDTDVFPQGRPTLTAVMRGAKVYDPRKDSTVAGGSGAHRIATPSTWEWSENPALLAYHYARWAYGWNLSAADIMPAAEVGTEATACDESTVFTLRDASGATSTVTLPRYRCGITIKADDDPASRRRYMDEIVATMAGADGWDGGVWRFRAGRKKSAVATLDESWLSRPAKGGKGEPVLRGANAYTREQRFNAISGKCIDPAQRYQLLPYPAVRDSVLISAHGLREDEIIFEGANHVAHAQHLASIAIRAAQAGTRIEAMSNMYAYRVQLFDVLSLRLARQGMDAALNKDAEAIGRTWSPRGGIKLRLAEISGDMFTPLAELVGRDPAPDSNLRPPWDVEDMSGLGVTSGTTPTLDGSIITRTVVEWDAAVGANIRQGGKIEVQYTPAADVPPAADWPSWLEAGSATKAVIPGLLQGRHYLFRVRAVQQLPLVRGDWTPLEIHKIASTSRDALQASLDAATDAASAAALAADDAQDAADLANATLADIASDSVLTPGEKPRVIQDYTVITAEQSGIDAQATNYGVTTEKTAYDTALSALTTYLGTLTSPAAWNNLTGNTTIVGTTFRSKFADVYTTRQALLDAISAAAKSRLGALATLSEVDTPEIAPGATTDTFYDVDAGPVDVVGGADVLTRTVGPYSAEVTLVVTFTGQIKKSGTFSGGPSAVSAFARIDDDEDGTGMSISVGTGAINEETFSFAVTKRIVLPASTSCAVVGFASVGASGPVLTLDGDAENTSLLVEVLKN